MTEKLDSLQFVTVDVFTDVAFSGNPLAIVFLKDSSSLTQAQKLLIAREFNLSETIFVHPTDPGSKERTVDIFFPTSEIPFAGHPVVGTATWLLYHSPNPEDKDVRTIVTKAGPIPVVPVQYGKEKLVSIAVPHNTRLHSKECPTSVILNMYPSLTAFISEASVPMGFPSFSIVKGMSQIFVKLPSLEALASVSVTPHVTSFSDYRDDGWEQGITVTYFYVTDVDDPVSGQKVIRTRAIVGMLEDPATGSAASALASYLTISSKSDGGEFRIVQGVEMGRRSDIFLTVKASSGTISSVELSGTAAPVSEGQVRTPQNASE